jgi:flagellar hook assembly protein FlgD
MIIGNGLNPYVFEGENDEIVSDLSVKSAYPNPFNPSTNIEYSISQSGNVKIAIYDVAGRQVDVLSNEYQSDGNHSVVWNAINSPSGIYYIQIQADNDVHTQKVVLLK